VDKGTTEVVGALALTDGKQPGVAKMVDHFEGEAAASNVGTTPQKNANKKKARVGSEVEDDEKTIATSVTSFEGDRRAQ
jgi:hypothetical protein